MYDVNKIAFQLLQSVLQNPYLLQEYGKQEAVNLSFYFAEKFIEHSNNLNNKNEKN